MRKFAKFVISRDKALEWRWKLVAPNGQIVAVSGESYTRHRDACRATHRVISLVRRPPGGVLRIPDVGMEAA